MSLYCFPPVVAATFSMQYAVAVRFLNATFLIPAS